MVPVRILAAVPVVAKRLSRPDQPARPLAPVREHEVPPSRTDHPLGRAESLHPFDRDARSPRTRLSQDRHVSIFGRPTGGLELARPGPPPVALDQSTTPGLASARALAVIPTLAALGSSGGLAAH